MSDHAQKSPKPAEARGETALPEAPQPGAPLLAGFAPDWDSPPNPTTLLQLQRVIGNQAVLRLLQRQATAAAPLLSAPQIANARRLYTAQSRRYTPAIIEALEGALSRPVNGTLEDDDILAIAQFQQAHPPLEVDGFAGSHTLSVLFPFGLAEQASIEAYVGEFADLRRDWRTLDATGRIARLRTLIAERMQAAGVTPADIRPWDFGASRAEGSFDFTTWTLNVNQQLLDQAHLEDSDARGLMTTLYHEARHAEQYFAIARWLAGQGMGLPAIRHRMRLIDLPVITTMLQAASANPIQADAPEAILAQDWYSSYYGRHAAETADIYADAGRTGSALTEAEIGHTLNPADPAAAQAEDRASARFDADWEDYHDLPMEFDAHYVHNAVNAAYTDATGRGSDSAMIDEALEGTGLLP